MIPDPRSLAWRLEACRYHGLVIARRGTPVLRGDAWVPDETPWARAPARPARRGIDHGWPELDHPIDSPWARCWVIDACTDPLLYLHARRMWSIEMEREMGPDLARLWMLIDGYRPSWDEAVRTLDVLASDLGAPARGPAAPLTAADAARVLGWPVERVRAAVRRGDVRTTLYGRRRLIPVEEVERLILTATPGSG